jgi:glycosyltransferase involved in cell wall biosynthesis
MAEVGPCRRVLTVLLSAPVPPVTGLDLRQLCLLRLVRDLGCESSALVFTTAKRPTVSAALSSYCQTVLDGGRRIEYGRLPAAVRVRSRLRMLGPAIRGTSGCTYPLSLPYDLAGAQETLRGVVERFGIEVVLLPTTLVHYAPMLRALDVVVIGDAADITSELTRRVLRYGVRQPWRVPGLLLNHVATRSQDRLHLGLCQEIWATTEAEAGRLRAMAPQATVVVAGNAVDPPTDGGWGVAREGCIGFIGNLALRPNQEAVVTLVKKVLPAVRARRPGVRLSIAGTGLPPNLESRLARAPGVEWLGCVPDASKFMQSCNVMVLPIRVRAGVPMKLIEGLASNRPVVATEEIVSGLRLEAGKEILVGKDTKDLAALVTRLLDDRDLAVSVAARARSRFRADHSYEASLRRLQSGSFLAS